MEYEAVEELRAQGYEAQRTAGSHSPFDIVAWDSDTITFIQVKRVDGPVGIMPAVVEARNAWRDRYLPELEGVRIEVWVRCQGKWHTFRLD
jgi:Holliday junction resolvase